MILVIVLLYLITLIDGTHVCHSNVNWQPVIDNNNNNNILWSDSRFNWDINRYPTSEDNIVISTHPGVLVNEEHKLYAVSMNDGGELFMNGSVLFNSSSCTAVNIPDPVTGVSFINTQTTTSHISVNFNLPHDNGFPILYYTWTFNQQCAINITSNIFKLPIPSCLIFEKLYNVTVTATNVLGTSLISSVTLYQHRLPPTKPVITMSLVTLNNHDNQLKLNWTVPQFNGGLFLYYNLHVWDNSGMNYTTNTTVTGSIININPGSWYYAKVTVYTSFPVSNTSNIVQLYTGPILSRISYVSSTLDCNNAYNQGLSLQTINVTLNSTVSNENLLVLYGKNLNIYPNIYVSLSNQQYQFNCTIKCLNSTFIVVNPVGGGVDLSVEVVTNGIKSLYSEDVKQIFVDYPKPILTPRTLKALNRPLSIINDRGIVSSSGLGEIIEIFGKNFGNVVDNVVVKYGLRNGIDDTQFTSNPAPYPCVVQNDLLDDRIRCYVADLNQATDYRSTQGVMIQVTIAGQSSDLPSTDRINFPQAPQVFSISGCCNCPGADPNTNATKICNCPTAGGGETITIFGAALGVPNTPPTITVGGQDCSNVITNSERATCILPPGTGLGNIGVTSNGLSTVTSIAVQYSGPFIQTVTSPNCTTAGCPRDGNIYITLNGENFGEDDATVLIGSKKCPDVTHMSDKSLKCLLPAGVGDNIPILMIQNNGFVSTDTYTNTTTCQTSTVSFLPALSYQKCPPGTEANGTECITCSAGKYGKNEECTICEGGKYANASGLSECYTCEAGRYSIVESSLVGPDECISCEPGSSQPSKGRTFCSECAIGYFSSKNESIECHKCEYGVPEEAEGSTKCINCTAPLFKLGEDATSCSSCGIGQYYNIYAENCLVCPENYICSNGEAFVSNGFWSYQSNNDLSSKECPVSEYCVDGTCAKGRKTPVEANPFCGQCKDGLYDWGGACVKCDSNVNAGYLFTAIVVSIGLVIFVFLMSQIESGHWKIFLFFVQTAILSLQSVESNWTAPLKLLDAGFISFSGESCVAKLSPEMIVFFEMLVTTFTFIELFLLMIIVAALSAGRFHNRMTKREPEEIVQYPWEIEKTLLENREAGHNRGISNVNDLNFNQEKVSLLSLLKPDKFRFAPFIRCAIALFIFNYNAIVRRSFNILDCVSVESYSVMRTMPSVDCNSEFYATKLEPAAYILLTIFIGIVPLGFLLKLYYTHPDNGLRRRKFVKVYGNLVEPYKHERWYFSLVHITRRTVLVAVAVFTPKDAKLPALALTTFIILSIHRYFEPFGGRKSNKWETISLSALIVLSMLVASMHDPLLEGESVFIAIYTFGFAIAIALRTVRWKWKIRGLKIEQTSPREGNIGSFSSEPHITGIELTVNPMNRRPSTRDQPTIEEKAEQGEIINYPRKMSDSAVVASRVQSNQSNQSETSVSSIILPKDSSWKKHKNDDGIPYYFNEETQETTWILPDEVKKEIKAKQ